MEADFLELLTETISVEPYAGTSANGWSTEAFGAAVTGIRARIVHEIHRVRDKSGQERVSHAQIWMGTTPVVSEKDRFTYGGQTDRPIIVAKFYDENGFHHQKVYF